MPESKFALGEAVRFNSGSPLRPGSRGGYTVTRLLPQEGPEREYRIKSAAEPFERVARESQLDHASADRA